MYYEYIRFILISRFIWVWFMILYDEFNIFFVFILVVYKEEVLRAVLVRRFFNDKYYF